MTPRQISAVLEHSAFLDRMQDSRDLYISLLASGGDQKQLEKHFEAWSEGTSPAAAKENKRLTEEDKARLMAMRAAWDSERKKAG